MIPLSDAAVALLRSLAEVPGGIAPDDATLPTCRELEGAGLVLLSRPFTGPRRYLPTKLGRKLENVLARMDVSVPSP